MQRVSHARRRTFGGASTLVSALGSVVLASCVSSSGSSGGMMVEPVALPPMATAASTTDPRVGTSRRHDRRRRGDLQPACSSRTARSRPCWTAMAARVDSRSPTPTSRSAATTSSRATSSASRSGTSPIRRTRSCANASVCPGGQGDTSIYGNLLFMSVGADRAAASTAARRASRAGQRRALPRRAHLRHQRHGASRSRSPTCRPAAARTRTRWCTDPERPGERLRLCVRHRRACARRTSWPDARRPEPTRIRTPRCFRIDIIQVPIAAPGSTRRSSAAPRIFADLEAPTRTIARAEQRRRRTAAPDAAGAAHVERDQPVPRHHGVSRRSDSPAARARATASCSTSGIPKNPKRLQAVADTNFAYWHSATFNNDGTKVIFTDEWGGGTQPQVPRDRSDRLGRRRDLHDRRRQADVRGYYKMPAAQTETENCVAHNGSLIPVPGRDIMVQGWYQGGIRCSTSPIRRIRRRSPTSTAGRSTRASWSSAATGRRTGTTATSTAPRSPAASTSSSCTPSAYLTQNEIDAAKLVRSRVQSAEPAEDRLAGGVPGRARVPRPARARQRACPRTHDGDREGAGQRGTDFRRGAARGAQQARRTARRRCTLGGGCPTREEHGRGAARPRARAVGHTMVGHLRQGAPPQA